MGNKKARKQAAEKASKAKASQESVMDTENVPNGEYVGTLRWTADTELPPLPRTPQIGPLHGWTDFLAERLCGTPLMRDGVLHIPSAAMIDGLSFPLSFLWALRQMVFNQALPLTEALDAPRLRVIAAGCTHRLEQHILTHSNYFEEWATMLPRTQIDLFMIGPEMQGPRAVPGTADRSWTQVTERLRYTTSRETLGELLEADSGGAPAAGSTFVIVYNSGMASGDARLQESWRRDVETLLDTGLLAIFTCANDYLDLRNERALMSSLGALFLLEPRENPFAAATTLHPPGNREEYTRANAFMYAVRGRVDTDGG